MLDDGENFSFPDFIRSESISSISSPCEYFITSRIDNDDAYEKTYIEKVQDFVNNLQEMKTCFITFPYGEQLDLASGKRQPLIYDENHFTSMLAPVETNIFQYNHVLIKESGHEIVSLETYKPMWTEIIHELNYANQFVKRKFNLKSFLVNMLRKVPLLYMLYRKAKSKFLRK